MAEWFEEYDDEAGRRASQLRTRRLVVVFALVSGAVVAGAPVGALIWPRGSAAVAGVGAAILVGHGGWLVWQLVRTRRAVWRIALSVHHIVAHDATGLRRVLAWADVSWVDVGAAGIDVVGRRMGRRVRIVVPPAFPGYGRVGHRLVTYAEAFRRPVYLDGRPWQSLGIDTLRPLLSERREPSP